MLRVRRCAWRVLPLLLLLALYWPGLTNWFYQDDFGWLNLRHDVHSVRDLGPALFAPKALQYTAARRERLFPGAFLAIWRGGAAVPHLGVRHANGQPGLAGQRRPAAD